jgi:hypothetical protein
VIIAYSPKQPREKQRKPGKKTRAHIYIAQEITEKEKRRNRNNLTFTKCSTLL